MAALRSRTVDSEVGPLHVRMGGEGPPLFLWHSLHVDSALVAGWAR